MTASTLSASPDKKSPPEHAVVRKQPQIIIEEETMMLPIVEE